MSDMNNPSDENTGALDDLWADALNEQKATTNRRPSQLSPPDSRYFSQRNPPRPA